jgi:hypothetical protein
VICRVIFCDFVNQFHSFSLRQEKGEQNNHKRHPHIKPHKERGRDVNKEGRNHSSEASKGVSQAECESTDLGRIELGCETVNQDEGQRDAELNAKEQEISDTHVGSEDIEIATSESKEESIDLCWLTFTVE